MDRTIQEKVLTEDVLDRLGTEMTIPLKIAKQHPIGMKVLHHVVGHLLVTSNANATHQFLLKIQK